MTNSLTTQLSAHGPNESSTASFASAPPPAKSPSPAEEGAPVNQVMENAKRKLQDAWLPDHSHLQLEVDTATHIVTVKVISDRSGEVIRQISSDELIGLAGPMENGEGVLVNRRI